MTKRGLHIYKEILVRLHVNDLIRCKSVCKSWNSLILSPRFVKSQLNYNLKKKVDNNETGDTRIIGLGATRMCRVVGSSNGLVCISRNVTEYLVVNPSTHKVKKLRNPPQEYNSQSQCVSGFGYDSSIDDYKVVIGFYNKCSEKLSFKVLTLKSNAWRSVYVESGYGNLFGNGILCNGAIHWYKFQNHKQVIVSFDLSKEVFKEIPQPKLHRSDWELGTMKDCLCIFASPSYEYRDIKDVEIWVMRSYNVQDSWERKLLPPGYDTCKILMHYILPKYFFNRHVHIWLLEEGSRAPVLVRSIKHPHKRSYYDTDENAHIRLSTNSECNYNYNHHVFVKSLVSPHGMGDGDGYGDGDGDEGDGNINDVISLSTLFL